jgi:hypothetical protein
VAWAAAAASTVMALSVYDGVARVIPAAVPALAVFAIHRALGLEMARSTGIKVTGVLGALVEVVRTEALSRIGAVAEADNDPKKRREERRARRDQRKRLDAAREVAQLVCDKKAGKEVKRYEQRLLDALGKAEVSTSTDALELVRAEMSVLAHAESLPDKLPAAPWADWEDDPAAAVKRPARKAAPKKAQPAEPAPAATRVVTVPPEAPQEQTRPMLRGLPSRDETRDVRDLATLTRTELRALAKRHGVRNSGSKEEMRDLLEASQSYRSSVMGDGQERHGRHATTVTDEASNVTDARSTGS